MLHLKPAELLEVRRILAFWAPGVPTFAFGSRATGHNLKETSDLDLCFKDINPASDKVRAKTRDAFDISDLPMRVDWVDWHDLSHEFRQAITRDLVPVGPRMLNEEPAEETTAV